MEYPMTSLVLEAVKNRVGSVAGPDGEALLKDVKICALTSFESLLDLIPEISSLPCAVVTAGQIEPLELAVARETEVVVIVLDSFRADACDTEPFDRLDRICAALTGESPGKALELGTVKIFFHRAAPLDVDPAHLAWIITLRAKTSFITN